MMEIQDYDPKIHGFYQSIMPPLVLRWSQLNYDLDSKIEMAAIGTDMSNQLTGIRLLNEFGQRTTPAFVGWKSDHQKFAILKDSSLTLNSPITKRWNLGQLLADRNINFDGKMKTKTGTIFICFEFLLAFLLKRLKNYAEEQIRKTIEHVFSSTIITIPFWLSSTQRRQIKDAAKLAGFTDVYIVNESSAAAIGSVWSGTLIVLIESGLWSMNNALINRVDAFVYRCDAPTKRVEMLSHSNNLVSINNENAKEGFFAKLFSKRKANLTTNQEMDNADETTVRRVAGKAVEASKQKVFQDFVVCISSSKTWDTILQNVGEKFGVCLPDGNSIVLVGALYLSMKLIKIKDNINDLLTYDIKRQVTVAKTKVLVAKRALLPLEFQFEVRFDNDIYQVDELGQNLYIGQLKIKNLGSDKKVEVFGEVDHEGKVKFKDCKVVSRYCWFRNFGAIFKVEGGKAQVSPSPGDDTEFKWSIISPNLSREIFSKIALQLSAPACLPNNSVQVKGKPKGKIEGVIRVGQHVMQESFNNVVGRVFKRKP